MCLSTYFTLQSDYIDTTIVKDENQTFEVNGEATEASACDNEIPACATLRA